MHKEDNVHKVDFEKNEFKISERYAVEQAEHSAKASSMWISSNFSDQGARIWVHKQV